MPRSLATVRGVILDLDDTLYPERSYFLSGLNAVADWLGRGSPASAADWRTRLQQELETGGRTGILDRIPAPNEGPHALWMRTLLHIYRTHAPTIALFPDAHGLIEHCRTNGIGLAIVTDGKSCVQHAKIRALGLEKFCTTAVCTDDIEQPKPSLIPFQIACAHLGLPPQACAYIADDASKDFVAPNALGMRSIQIDRCLEHPLATAAPDDDARAQTRIRSLEEAIPFIVRRSRP